MENIEKLTTPIDINWNTVQQSTISTKTVLGGEETPKIYRSDDEQADAGDRSLPSLRDRWNLLTVEEQEEICLEQSELIREHQRQIRIAEASNRRTAALLEELAEIEKSKNTILKGLHQEELELEELTATFVTCVSKCIAILDAEDDMCFYDADDNLNLDKLRLASERIIDGNDLGGLDRSYGDPFGNVITITPSRSDGDGDGRLPSDFGRASDFDSEIAANAEAKEYLPPQGMLSFHSDAHIDLLFDGEGKRELAELDADEKELVARMQMMNI
jgi:hypothetical protein